MKMEDLQKFFPTHDELQAIIEKIAEFLKNFFKIFESLKAGIAETFAGYKSPYGTPTDAATGTDA